MKIIRKIGILNSILIGIIVILWGGVFFINGSFGVYAWVLLKLVFPFIGVVGVLLNLILFIIFMLKKKKLHQLFVNFLIQLVLIFPILMTMNIIHFAYPIKMGQVHPSVTVTWPFNEETVVVWGGDKTDDNLIHVTWPSERWAYDLVMEPYDTGGVNNEEYGIWDKEVFSPVTGTVVAVNDEEDDIPPGTEEFTSLEGNFVYIKIAETGTFLLLNHLKKESVVVEVGQYVNQGELLGRVGNSGSTSEPHLHIQHSKQNPTKVPHPLLMEGLPLYFEGIQGNPMPIKGEKIFPKTS